MRTVAEYRNGEWNRVGDMLFKREGQGFTHQNALTQNKQSRMGRWIPRQGHNAILNGNIALIMGGFGSL